MTLRRILAVLLLLAASSSATDISGTVTNRTTNKPSAADDVILLELKQGMQEVARAKTDAQGRYVLHFAESQDPHLVRVNHRNVNYHKAAPPGATRADVDVYDAAEQVDHVTQSIDVMRIEAEGGSMRVVEMFSVNNASQPPRTLMSAKSFEVALPDGAQLGPALAAGPGGMPVNTAPVPTGEKNHYAFLFPVRPGENRFQLSYTMPYTGNASFRPKPLRATDSFAVSVPKSMTLSPVTGSKLEAKGEDAGMQVFVAQNVTPGSNLGFTLSGTGTVPLDKADAPDAQDATASQPKPGGGMAEPVNTPDPLYKYRWWLIGGIAIALVAGAAYSMSAPAASSAPAGMQSALKEELFRLESERIENKISADDYAKAKAALDVLMARVARRKAE